jgi:hypothetical protein
MTFQDPSRRRPANETRRSPARGRPQGLDVERIVDAHLVPRMDDSTVADRQAHVAPVAMRPLDRAPAGVEDEGSGRGWRSGVVRLDAIVVSRRCGAVATEDLDPIRTLVGILHEGEAAQRIRALADPVEGPGDGARGVAG